MRVAAPREFGLAIRSKEFGELVQQVAGRTLKVTFQERAAAAGAPAGAAGAEAVEEATRRALAHPVVQKFRELFPDSEVRVVRNLKQ